MSQGVSTGMLESQCIPEFCKGRKVSAAAYAECPSTSSFGYSTTLNPRQKTIYPSVSCHSKFFVSPQPFPFALVLDAKPPASSPETLTMSPHW